MRKPIATLVAVVLTAGVAVLAGCSKSAPEAAAPAESGAPSAPEKKTFVIGMSQCNLGEPWRVQMNKDIEAAAKAHDTLKVVFKDAQNDTLVQQNHVREFMNQGVDLLIISPREAAPLTGPVAEAYKKGIPVIVLDRALLGEDFTMFIGADNRLIGEAAGKWVREKLNGQGKIVELMGLQTSVPGHDRHDGFVKGLGDAAIETIFSADMKWLQPDAQREMESALARFPKIDLVYGHNDPGAYGAYLAAKAAGREKEMLFVGIDGLPHEGRVYVEKGILSVTFEYPTGGREAVEFALKILAGEQVPRNVVLPSRFFTPENLAAGGELIGGSDAPAAAAP
ncbi:MAG TPA: substrate-binding domain-containing protein [Candidatus Hydrogenedentes bacterium]|nr:substrate-binding domain-containing protein [Candidatus Hydrogenedentota bacterium]